MVKHYLKNIKSSVNNNNNNDKISDRNNEIRTIT